MQISSLLIILNCFLIHNNKLKKLSFIISLAPAQNSYASSLDVSLTSIFGMQTLQELYLDDDKIPV